mmetsp:Transcript_15273/g.22857  ORF Transcript_15273/g.22857 Transcript_15273/m.22857 type:complete len:404 (+) Transcript_15273:61-1272(+)
MFICKVTRSGTPQLLTDEGEMILSSFANVSIECNQVMAGSKSKTLDKGVAHITSHRLIWMPQDHRNAFGFSFLCFSPADVKLEREGHFFSKTERIYITYVEKRTTSEPSSSKTTNSSVVKSQLRVSADSTEKLHQSLMRALDVHAKALQQKEQERVEEEKRRAFDSKSAGISGIVRNIERNVEKRDQSLQEAFQDLDALMLKAKEMVALAKKVAALQQQTAVAQSEPSMGKEQQTFNQYMMSVGIANPVTKRSTGSLFHSQLARELSEFLQKPLAKHGGVLTLPDVYCIFNRARGTELISPDDLVRASHLFRALDLPVELREFRSGVLVVQSKSHSDEAITQRLLALVKERERLTPLDVSKLTDTPHPLAKEQLLIAEQQGVLCRDESFEGLVFYENLFLSSI